MPYRNNLLPDGTPIQQSMTRNVAEYQVEDISVPLLGVVLTVRPADNVANRSAKEHNDYRGYIPECSVYIPDDNMVLDNVLITPDAPSGLGDFYERLPRGSESLVDGSKLPNSFGNIDPSQLDGDWCIIGFFKGLIDSPYIMRWWPNPNNRLDPATSGLAYPNPVTGEGRALNQAGRYFTRINGVECVISSAGNVALSTRFANSKLEFSGNSATTALGAVAGGVGDSLPAPNTEGRWKRAEREDGGAIRLQVKPSQTFEIDFAPAIDGMGWDDLNEEQLPQTNPQPTPQLPPNRSALEHTYARFDTATVEIDVPSDFKVTSNNTVTIIVDSAFNVSSRDNITMDAGSNATLTSPEIYLAASNEVIIGTDSSNEFLALGTKLITYLSRPGIIQSPMGPLRLLPPNIVDPVEFPDGWDSLVSDKHKIEERTL